MRQIVFFLLSFVVAVMAFNNCGQGFKLDDSLVENSGFPSILGCTQDSPKMAENRVHALGASEYISIAEDLFPGSSHQELEALVRSLPVVPSAYDGNLEIIPRSRFVLDREGIANYFAKQMKAASTRLPSCNRQGTQGPECRASLLKTYLHKIYRQEISEARVAEVLEQTKDLSFDFFLSYLFMSPEFHFKAYSSSLTPYELVVKISMALFGSFPDEELVEQREVVYRNPKALRAELRRLLSQGKYQRRFSERFWGQWIGINQLQAIELPEGSSIEFNRDSQVQNFYHFIESSLRGNRSLVDLFYREEGGGIPQSILTHPAFTMATSRVRGEEVESHYVSRGVNVASKILCLPMPALDPATIEEIGSTTEEAIERGLSASEMIDFHRSKPQCSSCHSLIDPIGVSLEQLSPFGHLRSHFHDGSAIPKEGEVLGRSYYDLRSFLQVISESGQLRSCFMQNVRALADGQADARVGVCDAQQVYSDGNTSLLDSLTQFFSSPGFISRSTLRKVED